MNNRKIPKKVLRISDLTFILPDDFSGNIGDALNDLTRYVNGKANLNDVKTDETSTIETIFNNKKKADPRLCMKYGLFESDDDGNYKLQ